MPKAKDASLNILFLRTDLPSSGRVDNHLFSKGHRVDAVFTLEQLRALCKTTPYDVVILSDLDDLSAIEVYHLIKDDVGMMQDVEIVLHTRTSQRSEVQQLGAVFLPKEANTPELELRLQRAA